MERDMDMGNNMDTDGKGCNRDRTGRDITGIWTGRDAM